LSPSGHLLRYVPTGLHFIPPSHSCVPYPEKGSLVIHIDDESFVSNDFFPYRVLIDVACTFDPLDASKDEWPALRNVTRQSLETDLTTELSYVVRHVIAQYSRENLSHSSALRTIVMDITEAVQARAHLGIRLRPANPINLVIDAPGLVVAARRRRLTVEALALPGGRTNDLAFDQLLKLISAETNLRVEISDQGALSFALAPGDETSLPQALDRLTGRFIRSRLEQASTSPDRILPEPAQVDSAPESNITSPRTKPPPRNPMELGQDESVVDTDLDSEGIFVPRHPDGSPEN
jgi:hypothetical protein